MCDNGIDIRRTDIERNETEKLRGKPSKKKMKRKEEGKRERKRERENANEKKNRNKCEDGNAMKRMCKGLTGKIKQIKSQAKKVLNPYE